MEPTNMNTFYLLVPGNESITCTKHPQLQRDKYCSTCDVTICAECAFPSHKQHDIFPVSELRDKARGERKAILAQLEPIVLEYGTANLRYCERKKLQKKCRDQAQRNIEQRSRTLEARVQKQKQEMMKMVRGKEKSDMEEEERIGRLGDEVRRLQSEVQKVETNPVDDWRNVRSMKSKAFEISRDFRNMAEIRVDLLFQPILNNGVFGELKKSTFIGGVIVKSSQLVNVYDERLSTGNIVFICFDRDDLTNPQWRYSIKSCDVFAPVIISDNSVADGVYHLILAAGCTVFNVKFHSSGLRYDSVDSVLTLTIDDESPDSWVTCIAGRQLPDKVDSRFAVLTRNSTTMRVFKLPGEVESAIDISGYNLLGDVTSLGYFGDTFACIIRDSDKITLFTVGDSSNQLRLMKPPSNGMIPVEITHTGSCWLVLSIRRDTKQWNAITYQTTGQLQNICYDDTYDDLQDTPVSIDHWGNDVFVSLANQRVVKFTC